MVEKKYSLRLGQLKNGSIQVPKSISNALENHKNQNDLVFELKWITSQNLEEKIYVSWSGLSTKTFGTEDEYILIDTNFAECCNLSSNDKVKIKVMAKAVKAESVEVIPNSIEDWEVLQLNAGVLELEFLNQCRVVKKDQVIPLWVRGIIIKVKVVTIKPEKEFISLSENSEIYVQPLQKKEDLKEDIKKKDIKFPNKILRIVTDKQFDDIKLRNQLTIVVNPNSILNIEEGLKQNIQFNEFPNLGKVALINRTDFSEEDSKVNQKQNNTNNPNVTANNINSNKNNNPTATNDTHAKVSSLMKFTNNSLIVTIQWDSTLPKGHVIVSDQIGLNLNANLFSRLLLSFELNEPILPRQLKIRAIFPESGNNNENKKKVDYLPSFMKSNVTAINSSTWITTCFLEWLKLKNNEGESELVLTHGMMISLPNKTNNKIKHNLIIQIDLGIYEMTAIYFSYMKVKKWLELTIVEDTTALFIPANLFKKEHSLMKEYNNLPDKLGSFDNIINDLFGLIRCSISPYYQQLTMINHKSIGVLICGSKGSGKTSLLKTIKHQIGINKNTLIKCINLECSTLINERVSNVIEKIKLQFYEAAWYSPSVLFMDNLDTLIPAEMEHMDSFRYKQLAECLTNLILHFRKIYPKVTTIATAQQSQSIHPLLLQCHVFTNTIHIKPPGKLERQKILEAIMSSSNIDSVKNSLPQIDLMAIASSTEGYLPADLVTLTERAVHHSAIRQLTGKIDNHEINEPIISKEHENKQMKSTVHNEDNKKVNGIVKTEQETNEKTILLINDDDFKTAQEDYIPVSLRGVKLQSSTVRWTDIGGLEETRKVLRETLEWPIKYQAIFTNCPLRLRSGLLLYGFPGCGKTMLASAIAKECHLNFITVKGPEILNKYIGASEQSVRDLFQRAQAAKPCVLFFDEFEAIAPRRGHDSTGVTDRVVNQLLTQMDGAEGLDGVYVLAATSRPDLIDPALLRPGRLDKSLLCHLPTKYDRWMILKAHANKFHLSDECNEKLEMVAEKCDNFTGADLQALLYSSHLEAVHESLEGKNYMMGKEENGNKEDNESELFVAKMAKGSKENTLTLAEMDKLKGRVKILMKKKGNAINNHSNEEVNGKVNEDINQEKKGSGEKIIIEWKHLSKAMGETNTSLPYNEILRLQAIYDEFQFGKGGDPAKIGKRATLG
ncbi:AAA-domain-containing protein [Neoconidiobolus thromboides FSU 785]|nr:AAA-domain-containing protein [Neoconidiobolus thromboides FSU 785]